MSKRGAARHELRSSGDDPDALVRQLMESGEKLSRKLIDRLKARGPAVAPALVAIATDPRLLDMEEDRPEAWAPLHAVEVLGELEAAEGAEPLVKLLDRYDDDRLADTAMRALGQIGPPAVPLLRQVVFDRQKNLYTRSRAAGALGTIGERYAEVRGEVVEILVGLLDPSLTREPDDETMNGFVVSALLDVKDEAAAPAILRAFEEDRVDTSVVDLGSVEEDLGLPPSDRGPRPKGRTIRLVCQACHREREHAVDFVYYDPSVVERREKGEPEPYDEFVVPRKVICPKCGAVDRYKLSSLDRLGFTFELTMKIRAARAVEPSDVPADFGDLTGGRVRIRQFVLEDGRPMHPLAALEMYRAQAEAAPEDPAPRLRQAMVLRVIGRRDEALEQVQEALRLDPTNLEAELGLGLIALDASNLGEARERLERVAVRLPESGLSEAERQRLSLAAVDGLAQIRAAELRAEVEAMPRPPAPASDPVPELPPAPKIPKVGRNEPCPCGSGKKYKKCHGR